MRDTLVLYSVKGEYLYQVTLWSVEACHTICIHTKHWTVKKLHYLTNTGYRILQYTVQEKYSTILGVSFVSYCKPTVCTRGTWYRYVRNISCKCVLRVPESVPDVCGTYKYSSTWYQVPVRNLQSTRPSNLMRTLV